MKKNTLLLAIYIGLQSAAIPFNAQAASVYSITGDDLKMNTLGSEYIHSRRIGLMPYWGPCYRCPTTLESEAACTPGTEHVLAQWTSSGYSSCGGYETDSFEAYAVCENSGIVKIVLQNNSYDPNASVGQKNYGATVPIPVPPGGSYGQSVNMNSVFGGGNSCSQNFDWYPTYGITGDDVNGTFNGSITFGNYLSPGQYEQSPTYHVAFQNYKLVPVQICKDYSPTSSECQIPYANTSIPGIAVSSSNDGVSAIFCGDTQDPVENTAQGKSCPANTGITVCANGICRNWVASSGVIAGGNDSYQQSDPSSTYSPTGSYWDWGYCDGDTQTGSCSGVFTIYFGPTTSFTGPNFVLNNSTYSPSSNS